MLADCKTRTIEIRLNRDLIDQINLLKEDVAICNGDKAALREWKQQVSK